ncbi:MAG: thioredoxin family protein [Planctomycetaceae bacterium]|nr:thioredoxin family protein [Planctomycetaceae bacterium]
MLIRSILPVCLALASVGTVTASDGWFASYEEAKAAADSQGLPLLLHFHASYCGPCRQMKAQVFSQSQVQQQLGEGIAAVEVDVVERSDLAQQYGASTVPRDIVVYPGQAPQTLNVGFKSTLAYLSLLQNVASTGRKFSRPEAVVKMSTPQEQILGLEGFCPVRLVRDREWISGRRELTAEHRGITYHFSGEAEREAFLKDPPHFSPRNLGCDPVVLFNEQKATIGQIAYGVFFDDQLFLFDSAENRSEFKTNPLKYTRVRHAVRVDELTQKSLN